MPGPTIRAKVGDTIIVDIENLLDVPTTIHWHGLDVPVERMRALAGRQSDRARAIPTPSPWMRPSRPYHPHFDTVHQADRGLYGAFIVETRWYRRWTGTSW